ncbi:MAG: hypothetical protein ACRDYZ_03600 [Acidimicrobiales bacterium]
MILVDTSAWIESLRDTGGAVCARVDALLDDEIATCHPVRMELLAGVLHADGDFDRLAQHTALEIERA